MYGSANTSVIEDVAANIINKTIEEKRTAIRNLFWYFFIGFSLLDQVGS